MNTEQQDIDFAVKIARLLNEGTARLDADTSAKLLAVRKEALAHFSETPAHARAPEWVLAGVQRLSTPFGGNWRVGFAVLTLIVKSLRMLNATMHSKACLWKRGRNTQSIGNMRLMLRLNGWMESLAMVATHTSLRTTASTWIPTLNYRCKIRGFHH